MKQFAIAFGLIALLAPQAIAGDTKSAPVMGKLLPGKTDAERWKVFQDKSSSILGKTKAQVEKDLGAGQANGTEEVLYLITEPKKVKGKDEPGTQLIVIYGQDKVVIYKVKNVI